MIYSESALPPEIIGLIRGESRVSEEEGILSLKQLELIRRRKWFHLFVPKEYGGLALSLPEAVHLEESLACADGSIGWVVTLCAGAGMFIGYFNEALRSEVFSDPSSVCIAGSGQVNGTARCIDGGFEITGSWPYATGAPHASHFTANCRIEGSEQVQSFVFKKDEVVLHSNWKYMGLNATAGYSFSVNRLRVPANRTFVIDPAHAILHDPVYTFPFMQLAEATIAANISGMCSSFFNLSQDFLTTKPESNARTASVKKKGMHLISAAVSEIDMLRSNFYNALNASWISHVTENEMSPLLSGNVTKTSIQLAGEAIKLVNSIYPYCGMYAASTQTLLNQVWRNIHTASQHSLLIPDQGADIFF